MKLEYPTLNDDLRQFVIESLKKNQLTRLAEPVLRHARPQIILSMTEISENPPVGQTRFGGAPDLPADTPWPKFDGEPLRFMVQIRFSEIPFPSDWPFPEEGLLSIFAGYADNRFDVEHQVILTEDLSSLTRLDPPELPYEMEHLSAAPAIGRMGVSVPTYGETEWEALQMDNEETDRYFNLIRDLSFSVDGGSLLGRDCDVDQRPTHRLAIDELGGDPYDWQWEERNQNLILKEAKQWVPLFQMSSLMQIGLCMWDAYHFVALIRWEDLLAGRFDKTRGHLARI